jgi:hypothetical protein
MKNTSIFGKIYVLFFGFLNHGAIFVFFEGTVNPCDKAPGSWIKSFENVPGDSPCGQKSKLICLFLKLHI